MSTSNLSIKSKTIFDVAEYFRSESDALSIASFLKISLDAGSINRLIDNVFPSNRKSRTKKKVKRHRKNQRAAVKFCHKVSYDDSWLSELSEEALNHKPIDYWISKRIETLIPLGCEYSKSTFESAGFQDKAIDYLISIPKDALDHQSTQYWASKYIDTCAQDLDDTQTTLINNIPDNGSLSQIEGLTILVAKREYDWKTRVNDLSTEERDLKNQVGAEDNSMVLYHSTTAASAFNILQNGIDVTKGKENMDFTHGRGFYLNDIYRAAKEWPPFISGVKYAILIFVCPETLLQYEKGVVLQRETGRDTPWAKIVRAHRQAKVETDIKTWKKDNWMFGPHCINGTKTSQGVQEPKFHDDYQQFALRNSKLAKEFDGYLKAIIFVKERAQQRPKK